jgi:hypothetical protein
VNKTTGKLASFVNASDRNQRFFTDLAPNNPLEDPARAINVIAQQPPSF